MSGLSDLHNKLCEKPSAWCRALVGAGERDKLLQLEASVKSSMGKNVEKQLRVVKLLRDFEHEDTCPMFMKGQPLRSKDDINAAIMALMDLKAVNENTAISLNMDKDQELISKLAEATAEATTHVCDKLIAARKGVISVYEPLRDMMLIIDSDENFMVAPGIKDAVAHFEKNLDDFRDSLQGRFFLPLAQY